MDDSIVRLCNMHIKSSAPTIDYYDIVCIIGIYNIYLPCEMYVTAPTDTRIYLHIMQPRDVLYYIVLKR